MLLYLQKCRAWHLDIDQVYDCATYGALAEDGHPMTGDPAHWYDWLESAKQAVDEGFKPESGEGYWRPAEPPNS